jgi:hypothetical protein
MISLLRKKLSRLRRDLWSLGKLPYDAVVLFAMAAVLLESSGWRIRAPDRRPVRR